MSLREKAREIKSAGEEARGDFSPEGAPKRVYQFWLSESNSKRAVLIRAKQRTENFCHFWRVVAIWAPLMFMKKSVASFLTSTPVQIGLIIGAIMALAMGGFASANFATFLMIMGIAIVGVFGFVSGIAWMVGDYHGDTVEPIFKYASVIPTAWVPIGVTKGVYGMNKILPGWDHFLATVVVPVLAVIAITGLIIGGAVALVMAEGWLALLGLIGVLLAAVAVLGLMFFGLDKLGTYIKGRRSMKRRAKDEADDAFYDEHGYFPWSVENMSPPREPGRISKFFSGIGDFIVLGAQVIRVNKWKICPIVTIDND